jgi:hypothetical protein
MPVTAPMSICVQPEQSNLSDQFDAAEKNLNINIFQSFVKENAQIQLVN